MHVLATNNPERRMWLFGIVLWKWSMYFRDATTSRSGNTPNHLSHSGYNLRRVSLRFTCWIGVISSKINVIEATCAAESFFEQALGNINSLKAAFWRADFKTSENPFKLLTSWTWV